MAIGWDEGNPTDNSIVSQFPANERAQRAVQASAWAIEHDDVEGRHSFGIGNTAARDAITTWTSGAIWVNTSAGTGATVIQTVVSVTASVAGWDDVGITNKSDAISKVWGSFTSAGGINDSFNITSVDNFSAGKYRVTFTSSLPNANYSTALTFKENNAYGNTSSATASTVIIETFGLGNVGLPANVATDLIIFGGQ